MTERTTIRLPKDLLKRAKRKAAAESRTLTSLIVDGLRLVMDDSRMAAKSKRIVPRVSKATGGPMPSLELVGFPAFQEMDDPEYVRRVKSFE